MSVNNKLNEFIEKGYYLIFKFPLYKPIDIDLEVEEKVETEIVDEGTEDSGPTILEHTYFKENRDFSVFRALIINDYTFAEYCPMCNRTMSFSKKGKQIEEKYKTSTLLVDTNINSREQYEDSLYFANKLMNDRLTYLLDNYFDENRNISFTVKCTKNHKLSSIFHLDRNNKLIKVGQYPQRTSFDNSLNKYKKILGKEDLRELNRALGLVTHGIGAGSFVYLRRVFEKLIFESFEAFSKENDEITNDEFRKLHMDKKISLLGNYLPNYLVENKIIYGIISKGIHELTEKECLEYFDTMLKAIIIILDERFEKYNQENEKDEVRKRIQKINSEIKKGD